MKLSLVQSARDGRTPHTPYWSAFFAQSSPQVLPTGVEIFPQGALLREVYFIRQGMVKLIGLDDQGNEVIQALRSPGWLIGAFAALADRPTPLAAVTLMKTEVCRLPAADLRRLAETDVTFAHPLVMLLSRRAFEDSARQALLSTQSARVRLLQFLCQFLPEDATPKSGEVVLHIPLKDGEIAGYLAINPSTLSRLYGRLDRDGIIRRHKGRTIVKQVAALQPYTGSISTAWELRGGGMNEPLFWRMSKLRLTFVNDKTPISGLHVELCC
jgi:CRP/FNR family transcriptional regulator